MLYSYLVISTLAALACAAPAAPEPADLSFVTKCFNLFAGKATDIKENGPGAWTCDPSKAKMPTPADRTGLPPPAPGLAVKHVAIGRGTQNYSCATSDSSSTPVAHGALAALYNADCMAAYAPEILASMPPMVLQFNLTSKDQKFLYPASLELLGHHFFTSNTAPVFDLRLPGQDNGVINCAKNAATPAPADAVKGQGNVGLGAVPWLRLTATAGTTGGLKEVFRMNTAGGAAPPTCKGMPRAFEVQYAAEYWFFG